jgi:ADP-heptose:LPS heptosyltransferase
MKPEHILIIRFSALGDIAMLVPVVYSLAQQYPHLRVTVLSRDNARPFFDGLAPNVGFMDAELNDGHKGLPVLNALYRRLKAKHFTAIADMHDVLRSKYLRMRFRFDRFKTAHIDKHRAGKKRLTAKENKSLVQQPTSFQNYADVLAKLGYPIKLEFRSVFPAKGNLRQLLKKEFTEKKNFQQWIGVAPFAAHPGKVYPLERMEKVIDILSSKHPSARILLFGAGERERRCFSDWCSRYPRCVMASDIAKGLSQELILMSHLDVMLSMDSANTHLASLVDVTVVNIWGATHPYAGFMGWRQTEDTAVQINLPCRPCSVFGDKPCHRGDMACMTGITPEKVVERVEQVLDGHIKR